MQWVSPTGASSSPAIFRVGRNSASPSPGRFATAPRCCWPMSPRPTSTRRSGARCWSCSAGWRAGRTAPCSSSPMTRGCAPSVIGCCTSPTESCFPNRASPHELFCKEEVAMKSRIITVLAALALAWISAPARAQKPAALPAPATIRAEGRLEAEPGAHVVVGTEMAGTIVHLAVKDRQEVKKGQVLVELRADAQLRRAQHLAANGSVAQEYLDRAQRDHGDAEARLDQSRARTAGALARASAAQAGAERLR